MRYQKRQRNRWIVKMRKRDPKKYTLRYLKDRIMKKWDEDISISRIQSILKIYSERYG